MSYGWLCFKDVQLRFTSWCHAQSSVLIPETRNVTNWFLFFVFTFIWGGWVFFQILLVCYQYQSPTTKLTVSLILNMYMKSKHFYTQNPQVMFNRQEVEFAVLFQSHFFFIFCNYQCMKQKILLKAWLTSFKYIREWNSVFKCFFFVVIAGLSPIRHYLNLPIFMEISNTINL